MENPIEQTQQPEPSPTGRQDRRSRKPDLWARVFRYVTLLVYPLLLICVLISLALVNVEQRKSVLNQMDQTVATEEVASLDLSPLVPILLAGLVIGIVGLGLSRIRARRRSDYNFRTQLILILLSAGGLLFYYLLQHFGVIQ